MPRYQFDLFVIGGGSGGVRAARMAAAAGARVAIAEEHRYGGTCVIRGCVPKKLLVYASHFREDFEDAAGFGWSVGERSFDWQTLIANKDREIDRLNSIYIKLLREAGCSVRYGRAVLTDPHTVTVDGESVTAETILVATGGAPVLPDGVPGVEHGITSNEAFHLPALPNRIAVVGGGYIAVEFAGIFNGLGAHVVELYRGEQILRGFDDDIRYTLADELVTKGIDLHLNADVARLDRAADGSLVVTTTDRCTIDTDAVLFGTGRRPNTADMGLVEAGVMLDGRGAVEVDAYSRTSVPHIYAVGDVTDRIALTPVAIAEAMAFVDTVYRGKPRSMDHADVPAAVFSQPPVATVGLTEAQARHTLGAVDVYRSTFRPLKHTLSGRDERSMMKLVVERSSQEVVGAHMVGLDAAEIIQGVAIAIKMGATKADFDATVGIHPTAAEEFVTMRQPLPEPETRAAE
jgi:glutathione reductase (NADPH)